jgi:hypothetical protein
VGSWQSHEKDDGLLFAGDCSMIIDCHVHLSVLGHDGQTFPQIRDSLLSSMSEFGIDYAFIPQQH